MAARTSWGWRPLLWFWLSVLSVTAAGGAVLDYLGPPPERAARDQAERTARDQVRSEPQRSTGPVEPEPPTMASAAAAMPLPEQSDLDAPPPPHPHPAPGAQAPGSADQDGTKPRIQPLVILHPASSGNGTAMAGQLAFQLGLASEQVAVGAAADAVPRAIIRFYAAEDHPLARRLGNELEQMGYAWRIENLAEHPSSPGHQPLEIWLPKR